MKYIVEHMEEGFSEWVILEYAKILSDVGKENLIICSLPSTTTSADIPAKLLDLGLKWTTKELDKINEEYPDFHYYTPESGKKICLLDPRAEEDLTCSDVEKFDCMVLGGILGNHPPRDRTAELKVKYPGLLVGRRLGDKQMSTDTAARTAFYILEKKIEFENIKFIDYPEFRFNKNEAVEMPFRYIIDDKTGKPILPDGMLELIKEDSEQSLDDLLA